MRRHDHCRADFSPPGYRVGLKPGLQPQCYQVGLKPDLLTVNRD